MSILGVVFCSFQIAPDSRSQHLLPACLSGSEDLDLDLDLDLALLLWFFFGSGSGVGVLADVVLVIVSW